VRLEGPNDAALEHARNQNVVDDSALKAAVETLTLVEEVKP
jgi:hypothetical protein